MHLKLKKEKGRKDHMKTNIIFLSFLLSSVISLAETIIQLPESNIQSDYVEINKMKNLKNIIVIEKKEIQEKGYTNLSAVLQDIPNIHVGTTSWGEIDIRGQGEGHAAKNLQVLIDGAPITTLVNHPLQTNYDVVPVENIERIEIIPGGGSIIYGSGTAGGVINITTNLSRLHRPINIVEVSAGTGGEKYNLAFGHRVNKRLNVQLSYLRNNQNLYFKDTYRHSNYFTAGLHYQISDRQNLSLRYSTLTEDGKFVRNILYKKLKQEGKNYRPEKKKVTAGLDKDGHKIEKWMDGYSNAKRNMDSFNLSYRFRLGENSTYLIDAFYNKGHFSNMALSDQTMYHHTYGVKNKLDFFYAKNTAFDGSSLLIGLDSYQQDAKLEYDDYKSLSYKDKTYYTKPLSFKYKKKTNAFYLLNTLKYGDWESSQGIRRDYTYWHFDKVASKNEGKETSHRHNTNYEFSLAYKYRDTGRIYARYERGFTSPDGLEITDDFSKQDIKPTKGKDEIYDLYEIGWKEYFGFTTLNLTAFYSFTDNEMSRNYVFNELGFGRKTINILKTKRKGIELSLSQKLGNLELKESYAYLKGKRTYNGKESQFLDPDDYVDWSNTGLPKVPKHSLSLEAKYHFSPKISVGLRYKYNGKYSNFSNLKQKEEEGYIKSHAVTDLSLHYQNEKGFHLYGGINNLFNEKYFEYTGSKMYTIIPAEERTFFVGAKYQF